MRVIGFAGWSGAGKTTLLARLIPVLVARGHSVSTLKHAHHNFDVDKPGKDSHTHRMAGATEVLVASANRWALMHELRGAPEPELPELLAHLAPVDLVLVEGYKRDHHPKIEIHRAEVGKPFLHPEDPHIVAIASDSALPDVALPVIGLDDVETIADAVERHAVPVASVRWRLPDPQAAG
ncbi:molybdopterin-guanine dinucleotide biosynthesis protein B [Ancylobacter sp. MQZ15Z-1]|uniref:Molybdopterin-guanine dinucleotide biosynthesis protein B n=1 Tax=Ancylobacter mangrovi TaxID=2972472 RepID=A0A9X2T6P1_9HYPH|nr:molybdopterin-guanine dinucleotide biosynthesis protein B [Ancylobacter mangrovi]MCS0496599.1 molybdopterin-guanine dinucleotide biosynthesis protein B [Ancylobacter mangrovi]